MNVITCAQCGKQIGSNEGYLKCQQCHSCICSNCNKNKNDLSNKLCPKCLQNSDTSSPQKDTPKIEMPSTSSHLVDVRVIQRDLVYVVGLPIQYANEDTLLKYEYFGQYGPIKKIVVNASHVHSSGNQTQSVSAYVTFRNCEDALECIYSLESFSLDGSAMKASFGTTKYCSAFLRGQPCTNPDCMYLHQCGEPADSFSKDEITGSCCRFVDMTRPTRPKDYFDYPQQDARPTILPPRRLLKKEISPKKQKNEKSYVLNLLSQDSIDDDDEIYVDSPKISLATQLNLQKNSFRAIFNTLSRVSDLDDF